MLYIRWVIKLVSVIKETTKKLLVIIIENNGPEMEEVRGR